MKKALKTLPAVRTDEGSKYFHGPDSRAKTIAANAQPTPAHPFANLFPPMSEVEFAALKADIDKNGQLEPIMLYRFKDDDVEVILDGRNRERACIELGLPVDSETFHGTEAEALRYVIGKNLTRRHLTESQRAAVGAEIENMKQGERTDLEPSANLHKVSRSDAAKMMKVSPRSIANAAAVKKASPELFEQVKAGEIKVSAAEKKVRESKPKRKPVTVDATATRTDDDVDLEQWRERLTSEHAALKTSLNAYEQTLRKKPALNRPSPFDDLAHDAALLVEDIKVNSLELGQIVSSMVRLRPGNPDPDPAVVKVFADLLPVLNTVILSKAYEDTGESALVKLINLIFRELNHTKVPTVDEYQAICDLWWRLDCLIRETKDKVFPPECFRPAEERQDDAPLH